MISAEMEIRHPSRMLNSILYFEEHYIKNFEKLEDDFIKNFAEYAFGDH